MTAITLCVETILSYSKFGGWCRADSLPTLVYDGLATGTERTLHLEHLPIKSSS